MRNLTIWGAVAVLAVLVATVAVFGLAGSAQADNTCAEPGSVTVGGEIVGGAGTGIVDNTYDVSWTGGNCGPDFDSWTVVLSLCDEVSGGACKHQLHNESLNPQYRLRQTSGGARLSLALFHWSPQSTRR